MKKSLAIWLIALALTAQCLNVNAFNDVIYSYSVENNEISLLSASVPCGKETLYIPSSLNGMKITE